MVNKYLEELDVYIVRGQDKTFKMSHGHQCTPALARATYPALPSLAFHRILVSSSFIERNSDSLGTNY